MDSRNIRRAFFLAVPILLAVLFATTGTSLVSIYDEREVHQAFNSVSESTKARVKSAIDQDVLVLEGIRAYWLGSQEVTKEEFSTFAANVIGSSRGLTALQWVDSDSVVRYVYPLEGENRKAEDFDNKPYPNRMVPLTKARETRAAVVTRPIMLIQGYPGIVIYLPIFRGEEYLGAAVGVASLEGLLGEAHAALDPYESSGFVSVGDVSVPIDGKAIYDAAGRRILDAADSASTTATARVHLYDVVTTSIPVADQEWKLVVGKLKHPAIKAEIALIGFFGVLFVLTVAGALFVFDRQTERLRDLALRERDFTSLVSHQLKLPLTQLSWILDTEFEKTVTPQQGRTVADMRSIVSGSVRLVNDLLNISRIERGVLKIEREEVPVTVLIDEVLLPFRQSGAARKVRIETDVPTGLGAYVDRGKAVEAIRNLVDNAIKYSPEGSTVRIAASGAGEGMTRIVVRDDGAGIPEEIRGRLFEKSSVYAKKGEGDGAGLGLYLAKQFITLMGGAVTFETSDRGTTFFLTVPSEKKRS